MSTLQEHFQNIHNIIHRGRTRALAAATAYFLDSYWTVGAYLSRELSEKAYGKKVVEQLASWLQNQEPSLKGFDRRSLYRMRDFFELWMDVDWSIAGLQGIQNLKLPDGIFTEEKIVVSVTPQLPPVPWPLTRISWTHHIEILRGTNSPEERLFYLVLAVKERYKVRELKRQIKSALFERQMLSKQTLILPEHPKKDLLPDIFRDKYLVEFLGLKEHHSEFELKKPHENPSIGVLFCKSKNDEVVEIAMSRQLSPTLVSAYETKFLDKKLLQRLLHDWSEEWAQQHNKDL